MAGNLSAAIAQAQAICWDETIGYRMGGMAYSSADGVDCSGLIGRCLHDNGFNYPSYHVGTADMVANSMSPVDALGAAGFTEIVVTSPSVTLQPGDIVVMNHLDWSGGHTFFYMENIQGYTDPGADSANIGNVQHCKVEASSTRGHTADGDHRKNGTGAYWEVWVHAYSSLFNGYDPTDPGDQIVIARWPGGLADINGAAAIIMMTLEAFRRRRDEHAKHNNWNNR